MYVSGADALIAKGRMKGLSEGRREGLSEGLTKGLAKAVLDVLAYRSLPISASLRRRVSSCRDEQRLRQWLERAITATSAAEVLDDE